MENTFILGVCAAAFAIPSAHAQSSVTIYGLMDAGVTMFSNMGGSKAWVSDSGVMQSNRLGFLGSEDLGGGTKAIFRLENGFSVNNGKLGQGGLLFGRQAYVGLSTQYGTVTLGRQYDFMATNLALDATAAFIGGLYAWHLDDLDRIAGEGVNSSIVYNSPDIHGLTFSGMYGFGGVAGDFNEGSAVSAGLSYANGPLNIAAAYTKVENTTFTPYSIGLSQFGNQSAPPGTTVSLDKTTNFGVGGRYALGAVTFHALFTWTQLAAPDGSSTLRVYDAGANYQITPALIVGGGYTYSSMSPNHWNQFTAGVDYFLSKRTDVYFIVNTINAAGPDVVGVLAAQTPSDDNGQTAVRTGIRSKF